MELGPSPIYVHIVIVFLSKLHLCFIFYNFPCILYHYLMTNTVQVFVRADKIVPLQVNIADSVEALKEKIQYKLGIPAIAQRLSISGRILESVQSLRSESFIDLSVRLQGGVMMEPTLQALARKHNCEKKICRKCYARLPPRAENCRKKKCGHTNQLRMKKKLK